MKARFRVRTRDGEEIEPRSVEIFAELVRSGVIRPEDLVYDALTGEWAPAATHPMVKLFLDPLTDPSSEALLARLEESAATEDQSASETDTAAAEAPVAGDDLSLDLVEEPQVSPEDEARAFIEKMEEERRSDSEARPGEADSPLLDEKSRVVEGLVPPREPPWGEPETASSEPYDTTLADVEPPLVDAPPLSPAAVRRRKRSLLSWGLITAAVALPIVALSLFAASRRGSSDANTPPSTSEEVSRPPRRVPQTEEQIRAEAFTGFLQRVEDLRIEHQVGDVPEAWLEGYYLADPVAYPQVREFWERYLAYAQATQAEEARLYREAYLDAANEGGLSGPVRSLRLASALEDFSSHWSEREAHYARVRELAQAALALDDLMVELHGRISYEPIQGEKVSADPVIEAAGTDPDAQTQLEAALDRVLAALHDTGGATALNREAVPGWVVVGLEKMEASGSGG